MEMLETETRARQTVGMDEYQQLETLHREYEKQLEQIGHRRPFTEKDWFEESVVKKRKLQVRDQMAMLRRNASLSEHKAAS
jgi:hypothetical protein